MAIAIANIGGFVASGILQPLVGWVVDSGAGMVTGGSADAYRLGIGVLSLWSLIGIVAACRSERDALPQHVARSRAAHARVETRYAIIAPASLRRGMRTV